MTGTRSLGKPWLIAVGSGAALLFAALWCARTPPVAVETVAASRAPLSVEVNTNGKIEPLPEAELRVHARLDGRIVEIPAAGSRVAAGDVILEIDAGPVASQLASAESERLAALESLRATRKRLDLLGRRAETDADLLEQGALTQQLANESRAAFEEAKVQVETLEREVPLRVASLDLRIQELGAQREAAVVRAPFAGTVYRTDFERGEAVTQGVPILWLADLSRLRVRANVDQVDLGRVAPGQKMRITSNAWPERSWSAVVSEVVPHVVEKANRAVAESLALVEPPSDGLVPGMTVDVDIVVDSVPDALQVPAAAIQTSDGVPFVYRLDDGRVRRTPVVLGRASVSAVEIVSGIGADDRVVLGGASGLEDGSRVEARSRDVAAR
jgi:RND family efflux transporter MFP subunit